MKQPVVQILEVLQASVTVSILQNKIIQKGHFQEMEDQH